MAATLGYEDHEGAPGDEMLAAAARIARGVDVPVTVDAEAGYGMEPAELVAALRSAGPPAATSRTPTTPPAACAIPTGTRSGSRRFARPRRRTATRSSSTPESTSSSVPFFAGAGPGTQDELVPEALQRANAYLEAGADCVYPIGLWETDALRRFISEVGGPVNVIRLPQTPSLAELAALGVARVSWATLLLPRRDGSLRGPARLASGVTAATAREPRSWP